MTTSALLALAILSSGCAKGKDEALIALDEARLQIAGARKVGATLNDPHLRQAEGLLRDGEESLRHRDFDAAREQATEANAAAKEAKNVALDAQVKAERAKYLKKAKGRK